MAQALCSGNICVWDGEPLLQAINVGVCYGSTPVLKNVSLDVQPCSVTAIIGPSGCGKSSFLGVLNRMTDLLPDCQVNGSILFDGEDILAPTVSPITLRQRVGMIFQKPTPFPLTIEKNITEPLKYLGKFSRTQRQEILETSLKQVGLWSEVKDRLHHSALRLSGGQQQRLCMARAISLKPKMLLMDEPCSALDPVATACIEELIQELRNQFAMVVVTHNLGQARRISDQTAFFWMQDGCGVLAEKAPTQQLFTSPQNTSCAAYIDGRVG